MDAYIAAALFLLFVGLIATLVRLRDKSVAAVEIVPFLLTFGSSLIAAVVALWILASTVAGGVTAVDYSAFANFIIVAGSAVGGISFIGSLISANKARKLKKPKA